MALRLAATGRQAVLNGGLADLFDTDGVEFVFRAGAVPADVDTVSSNTVIATLIDSAEPSYGSASDDGTTATVALDATVSGNAVSTYDYADGGDGEGHCEVFSGAGRTAADKICDFTVGGPGTTGTQDFDWDADDITSGGLITVTTASFTKS